MFIKCIAFALYTVRTLYKCSLYNELDLMGAEIADLNLVDYNAGEKAFFRRAVTKVCMIVVDGTLVPQHKCVTLFSRPTSV